MKESVVTAGEGKIENKDKPTAVSVGHRKNRRCWRTSWRTLRIYLRADSPRIPWAKLGPVRPSELILGGFCFRVDGFGSSSALALHGGWCFGAASAVQVQSPEHDSAVCRP